MFGDDTIAGPGYTVRVPPGFTFAGGMPAMGMYRMMPPALSAFMVEAMLQIRPVQSYELQGLMQNLSNFENPAVAQFNAGNLGMTRVLGILPVRQMPMPQGQTWVREFDAVNMRGISVRVMVMVMIGPQSAVEVVIIMSLSRWTEYVKPCLTFVAQISLAGMPPPPPAQLQAVVDTAHKDQVEYQLVNQSSTPVPMTALPTVVAGTVVFNISNVTDIHDLRGESITIGSQSLAAVQHDAQSAAPKGTTMANDSYTISDVKGTSVAIGTGATANVNNQADPRDLTALLASLRQQVQASDLPDHAKQVVLAGPVQQMETAAKSADPKPEIKGGLERINDQLQVLGVTASSVEGIVGTLSKIAAVAKVVVAGLPLVASLV